jgi:hypothetical protein
MNPLQKAARAYCLSIGADPEEIVWGYWVTTKREWISAPRWSWYQ